VAVSVCRRLSGLSNNNLTLLLYDLTLYHLTLLDDPDLLHHLTLLDDPDLLHHLTLRPSYDLNLPWLTLNLDLLYYMALWSLL